MRFAKTWLPAIFLGCACTVGIGCGGDDTADFAGISGASGSGGGGHAGTSSGASGSAIQQAGGTAGQGGVANQGGNAGQGGTAGQGGSATAGQAGMGGSGVDAGPDVSSDGSVPPDSSDGSVPSDSSTTDVSVGNDGASTVEAATDAVNESADQASSDVTSESAADVQAESSLDAEVDASDGAIADAADGSLIESKICAARGCDTNDECRADASTLTKLYYCDTTGHRCVACVDDMPCIAAASTWSKSCTADGDCLKDGAPFFGDYCVNAAGFGVCAFDKIGLGTSNCLGNVGTVVIAKFGSTETVEVCAKVTRTCDLRRGRCEDPCTTSCTDGGTCPTGGCTAVKGGKICNATTKRCECATDNDCASPTPHCNQTTFQCECGTTGDCSDGSTALVCK